MSAISRRCRKAFTILELLIVIAIILTLAAGGFAVGFQIIQKAKRTAALAVCTELSQGIATFMSDHDGTLPLELTEDATISSKSPEGIAMLLVLLNKETTDVKLNTQGRPYINIKVSETSIDGLVYDDSGKVLKGLVDPWGGDYKIRLDDGSDKRIEVKPKGSSKTRELNQRVAVWTDGRDGVDGTGESKDDVKSW